MKLFKKLALVLALGASLTLIGCGGDNPNNGFSASSNPSCTRAANWAKVSNGLTESNVLAVLGNPRQIISTSTTKTYNYEDCRVFKVEVTPDDPKTLESEQTYKLVSIGGVVVFNSAISGYVTAFTSPGFPTGVILEQTEF